MIIDSKKSSDEFIAEAFDEIRSWPLVFTSDAARIIVGRALVEGRSPKYIIEQEIEKWAKAYRLQCEELLSAVEGDDSENINDEELLARSKERRAMKPGLRLAVFQRDSHTCKSCGATQKDTKLHADHVIPISKGGKTTLENLQTLCESCNLAKASNIISLEARA